MQAQRRRRKKCKEKQQNKVVVGITLQTNIHRLNATEGIVRNAIVADAKSIAKLYNDNFSEHIMVQRGLLNNPRYIESRLSGDDEIWAVEEYSGRIRGVAALAIIRPVGLGEIERVCTDAEHRRNGVAYNMCTYLTQKAIEEELGFLEAFARGDQPGMQQTFHKLGFKVYGISPRFEVVHKGTIVREQFVHMGIELKAETIDETSMELIPSAREVYRMLHRD